MELRPASDPLGEAAREGVCPGAAEFTDGKMVEDGWLPVCGVPAVQPTNGNAKQRGAEARTTGMCRMLPGCTGSADNPARDTRNRPRRTRRLAATWSGKSLNRASRAGGCCDRCRT